MSEDEVRATSIEMEHPDTQSKEFQCDHCDFSAAHRSSIKKHVKNDHHNILGPTYTRHKDIKTSSNPETYITHAHANGEEIDPFQCDHCGYGFSDKAELKGHIRNFHDSEESTMMTNTYKPVVPQPGSHSIDCHTVSIAESDQCCDQEVIDQTETWTTKGKIRENCVGIVIGRKGARIKKLRLESGAKILIEGKDKQTSGRGFLIEGSREAICMAMETISQYDIKMERKYPVRTYCNRTSL